MRIGCSCAAYFSGCMTCSVDSGGDLKMSSTFAHGAVRRTDSTKSRPVRYGNISVSRTNAGALSNCGVLPKLPDNSCLPICAMSSPS